MKNIFSDFFFGLRDFLNGINNTVWGISMLYVTMHIFIYCPNQTNLAYYFAGIASTLLGIKHEAQVPASQTSFDTVTKTTGTTETPNA